MTKPKFGVCTFERKKIMIIKDSLLKTLDYDKVKINWNKNPIKMDLFLSFLTIETEKTTNHFGSSNGWTQRVNKEYDLIIGGGIVNGINYLDSIQYRGKLHNAYNNYVNPFFLFDIMTREGKDFFIQYYKEDIDTVIKEQADSIERHLEKIKKEQEKLDMFKKEIIAWKF